MKVKVYGSSKQVYAELDVFANSAYTQDDGRYGRFRAQLSFFTKDDKGYRDHIFRLNYLSREMENIPASRERSRIRPRYCEDTFLEWSDGRHELCGYHGFLNNFEEAVARAQRISKAILTEMQKPENHRPDESGKSLYERCAQDVLEYTLQCAVNVGVIQVVYDLDVSDWLEIPKGKAKLAL